MNVAEQYARLSYAQRRQVGCVIIIDDIYKNEDGLGHLRKAGIHVERISNENSSESGQDPQSN